MKSSKKMFILIESVLGFFLLLLIIVSIRQKQEEDMEKVSVIIQNSDENQWSSFKYGLRMAAEDKKIDLFIVSAEEISTAEEEFYAIEHEINKGAEAVIIQPIPGINMEEMLKDVNVPVMLVESTIFEGQGVAHFPTTEPDNYAMGQELVKELLKDNSTNLKEKKIGIYFTDSKSESVKKRRKGVEDALENTDAEICWAKSSDLDQQKKVDYLLALDDHSLVVAGINAKEKNLSGALVYGIGNSTEAAYYLDSGYIECLIVPDEFNVGYESLSEIARSLRHFSYRMKNQKVSYTIIRREDLFSEKNQEILFMMSQ